MRIKNAITSLAVLFLFSVGCMDRKSINWDASQDSDTGKVDSSREAGAGTGRAGGAGQGSDAGRSGAGGAGGSGGGANSSEGSGGGPAAGAGGGPGSGASGEFPDAGPAGGSDGRSQNSDAQGGAPVPDVALPDLLADVPASMAPDAQPDLRATDAPLKQKGSSCRNGSECESTFCVDDVCCDGECGGQCQACAEPNGIGTCTTVSGAPRGNRSACAATQATCAGTCAGSPTQCTYPGSETICSAAACSGDFSVKPASVCNSGGACTSTSVTSCGNGKYCSSGSCLVQIVTGACQSGVQCTTGNCSNGLCCGVGQTGCGTACVPLSSDNANCGTCGRVCASGSSCSGGACYLVDGQPCTSGSQCLSGVCGTFYFDSDGDGYGTSVSINRCGTTPPTGYARQSGDCCDSDKLAHPGQTEFYESANACGSFDYNCDGQESRQTLARPANCGTPTCEYINGACTYTGGCTCGGFDPCLYQRPVACGEPFGQGTTVCVGDTSESCVAIGRGGPWTPQPCN